MPIDEQTFCHNTGIWFFFSCFWRGEIKVPDNVDKWCKLISYSYTSIFSNLGKKQVPEETSYTDSNDILMSFLVDMVNFLALAYIQQLQSIIIINFNI